MWEYKHIICPQSVVNMAQVLPRLQREGRVGWELVTMVQSRHSDRGGFYELILKRTRGGRASGPADRGSALRTGRPAHTRVPGSTNDRHR